MEHLWSQATCQGLDLPVSSFDPHLTYRKGGISWNLCHCPQPTCIGPAEMTTSCVMPSRNLSTPFCRKLRLTMAEQLGEESGSGGAASWAWATLGSAWGQRGRSKDTSW